MTNHSAHIGFIGGGKMASAFITSILHQAICPAKHISVSTKTVESRQHLQDTLHILAQRTNKDLMTACDTIFLAIKPQELKTVLAEIAEYVQPHHLFISLVTGVSGPDIQKALKKDVPVVCVASNTPASIGEGTQAIVWDERCSHTQKAWVLRLCSAVGHSVEISADKYNAVMALAGSGPAFVFWLMQAFIKAGTTLGLDETEATQLTIQTFVGASKLAQHSDRNLSERIQDVSSPGGITIEGLKVLNHSDIAKVITDTIHTTHARAVELSK